MAKANAAYHQDHCGRGSLFGSKLAAIIVLPDFSGFGPNFL
jgi:hypothetical protein